jgi:tight adherence protein B
MTHAVEICDRLSALARAGYPVRRALEALPGRIDDPADEIFSVARRAALGSPIELCLEPLAPSFGVDFPRFRRCLGSAASRGANWARDLDEVSASLRDRETRARAAAISGAGATLSARTIAFLPFLFLPVAVKQITDPLVAASVACGLLLGYCGYRWLLRIVPAPPPDDRIASLAEEVAASLDAGISLDLALRDAVGRRRDLRPLLRKVDLGGRWVDLLLDAAPPIGRALDDAVATGVPVASSLRRSAAEIRREAAQAFEKDLERTPIRMVVPLVCCILPSFILVAIVPLLKGLAQPA